MALSFLKLLFVTSLLILLAKLPWSRFWSWLSSEVMDDRLGAGARRGGRQQGRDVLVRGGCSRNPGTARGAEFPAPPYPPTPPTTPAPAPGIPLGGREGGSEPGCLGLYGQIHTVAECVASGRLPDLSGP